MIQKSSAAQNNDQYQESLQKQTETSQSKVNIATLTTQLNFFKDVNRSLEEKLSVLTASFESLKQTQVTKQVSNSDVKMESEDNSKLM